jgi:hypothetical protein
MRRSFAKYYEGNQIKEEKIVGYAAHMGREQLEDHGQIGP